MITLNDGTNINFNTSEDPVEETTKLQVEFTKEFKKQDIEIQIYINGDVTNLKSGNNEGGFKITKKF